MPAQQHARGCRGCCGRMQDAISVIETDCEVDFAPPLDYVEPRREQPAAAPSAAAPPSTSVPAAQACPLPPQPLALGFRV